MEQEKIDEELELGKNIIRAEGINFGTFKWLLKPFFVNSEKIDEDSWVHFYNTYAEMRAHYSITVREWALEYFLDFNSEEHSYWLYKN
jgi:hypothetical protein